MDDAWRYFIAVVSVCHYQTPIFLFLGSRERKLIIIKKKCVYTVKKKKKRKSTDRYNDGLEMTSAVVFKFFFLSYSRVFDFIRYVYLRSINCFLVISNIFTYIDTFFSSRSSRPAPPSHSYGSFSLPSSIFSSTSSLKKHSSRPFQVPPPTTGGPFSLYPCTPYGGEYIRLLLFPPPPNRPVPSEPEWGGAVDDFRVHCCVKSSSPRGCGRCTAVARN